MKSLLILIAFGLFWVIFAIIKEQGEQKNAYIAAKKRDADSISVSLRKLRYCITYDLRTIKWRRSLISAFIITFMLFTLVWRRLPSPQELITHMLLITAVFSTMWSNFSKITSKEAAACVDDNIQHIKQLLIKDHTFILPNWNINSK